MIARLFDCFGVYCSHRVQEQENQKRKLCDELEQLKTPQDSREASCQTPVPEEEVRQEVDSQAEIFRPKKMQQLQHVSSSKHKNTLITSTQWTRFDLSASGFNCTGSL